MKKERITRTNLKDSVIDCHTHAIGFDFSNLIKGRYPTSNNIIELDSKTKLNGIDYYVAMNFCSSIYYDYNKYWSMGKMEASGDSDYPFQYENQYLLKCIEKLNLSRALPFLTFSLREKVNEQLRLLNDLASKYNVYGLKFHPKIDQMSLLNIENSGILEFARHNNIPILVHTEMKTFCEPMNVYEIAKNNPDIRFCAAHMGDFDDFFINNCINRPLDNLYFDCCPLIYKCKKQMLTSDKKSKFDLPYDNSEETFNNLFGFFPTKLLWGSDDPWVMVGNFNGNIDGASYDQEARIIRNCKHKNNICDNTINYLFGIIYD